jgi:hypothetical protein
MQAQGQDKTKTRQRDNLQRGPFPEVGSIQLSGVDRFCDAVDGAELSRPRDVVQKLTQVEAVVVRRVLLRVVRRCNGAHFMPVDRIKPEKTLDFLGDSGGIQVAPGSDEFFKHRHGSAPFNLTKHSENAQFGIRHPHFVLVQLGMLASIASMALATIATIIIIAHNGPQLGSRLRGGYFGEDGVPVGVGHVPQQPFQVQFRNRTDGVQIRRGAVVLGHVPTQTLVDVGGTQDQQETRSLATHPRQQLGQQIAENHPHPRL